MIEELTKQLRRDEGVVLTAYHDLEGWLTIGIGRLIDEKKGGGITQEEANYLLANDIRRTQKDLLHALPWAANLTDPRLGVLMAMAFNMGIRGLLTFKRFLAALERGDISTAAAEMIASDWSKQVGARASRLRQQLLESAWM